MRWIMGCLTKRGERGTGVGSFMLVNSYERELDAKGSGQRKIPPYTLGHQQKETENRGQLRALYLLD